jgi:alpha-tubulin suppressor-like RCC1 family protein
MCIYIVRFFIFLGLFLPTLASAVTPMVSAGFRHTVALKPDGTVVTWGANQSGQLGDGTVTNGFSPMPLPELNGVTALATGDSHTVALKSDNALVTWGDNLYGQLGDDSGITSMSPVPIPDLTGIISVAAGQFHTVALKSNGQVLTWGSNQYGQLGDGDTTDSLSPLIIPELLTGVKAVAAGLNHTVALKSDGTVMAWGSNQYGQLGHGKTTDSLTPQAVPGLTGVVAIAAGFYHTLALKSDHTVVAWGNNEQGQLGDGTFTNELSPQPVPGLTEIKAISAGSNHTIALKSNGTVATWGDNQFGQLGDGGVTDSPNPLTVPNLDGIMAIAAGNAHSVALKSDGTVLTWGENSLGQLGDGTNTNRQIPVIATNLLSTGTQSISGISFSLAALTVGETSTANATATSGLTVSFNSGTPNVCTVSGNVITSIAGGNCRISAGQGGDDSFSPAVRVIQSLTIDKRDQTVNFDSIPAIPLVGGKITISATASSALPVSFSSTTPSVCAVSGNIVTRTTAGTCTIAANQTGNTVYKAAQVTQSTTINKTNQTLKFGAAPIIVAGKTGLVSATATSGFAVSFKTTTPLVCTVSGRIVTGIKPGTCNIAANQAGNANYKAAAQITQSSIIGMRSQTIKFGAVPRIAKGKTGTVSAIATSGLAVSFKTTTPLVCSARGRIVTRIRTGICTIAADQVGNSIYKAAPQVKQNIL